jgi:hypothetical protein
MLGIPRERSKQFELIEAGRKRILQWARSEAVPLEHVEYVVPFVETDFGLSAWLFYTTQLHVQSLQNDGTSKRVEERLCQVLAELGYPTAWISQVECRFASKEEVDRDYERSYYNYVR